MGKKKKEYEKKKKKYLEKNKDTLNVYFKQHSEPVSRVCNQPLQSKG